MDEPNAIADAASLILMRRAGGGTEILFVERARTLRFGGGAIAFPGGRVDDADRALAVRRPDLAPADAAARIAAIRETWEETGIAIGFRGSTARGGFHEALAGALPDLAAIAPFARWSPPLGIARRFDTRFYVAAAPPGATPVADGIETAAAFWATAADVGGRWRSGTGNALFPTRRLVERLAGFIDAAAAAADPASGIDRAIAARLEKRADGEWLCIPDDAGYPVFEERVTPGLRG